MKLVSDAFSLVVRGKDRVLLQKYKTVAEAKAAAVLFAGKLAGEVGYVSVDVVRGDGTIVYSKKIVCSRIN